MENIKNCDIYKELIKDLSIIIDNIDTASDIAKSDNILYRHLIQNEIIRFNKIKHLIFR